MLKRMEDKLQPYFIPLCNGTIADKTVMSSESNLHEGILIRNTNLQWMSRPVSVTADNNQSNTKSALKGTDEKFCKNN